MPEMEEIMYNRLKKKKKNTEINFNTNYRIEMKLVPIIMSTLV